MSSPQQSVPQREVYRPVGARVLWWVWLAFAVANLADLAVQGHNHFAAVIAVLLVFITGVVYAGALRPRVIADEAGITLLNPLRDHRVPWGAVTGVDLGDTLQVHCRQPGREQDKILYSWAVQSSRRGRARAELRAARRAGELSKASPSYGRLPAEAREIMGKTLAELTVRQLSERATAAQARGETTGERVSRWAWWPIAAVVVPGIALLVVILL